MYVHAYADNTHDKHVDLPGLSAVTRLVATPEVTGSCPASALVQRLFSQVDMVSGTEGRETVCVTLQ